MNATRIIQQMGTIFWGGFLGGALGALGYGPTSHQWWFVMIPSIVLVMLFYTPNYLLNLPSQPPQSPSKPV